jgi:hypothetical protein
VYLDDQLSSVRIAYNTFDHVSGMLLELGGGRHNEFEYNTINGSGVMHMDNRGGGGTHCVGGSAAPYSFLNRVPYVRCSSPPISQPLLATNVSSHFLNRVPYVRTVLGLHCEHLQLKAAR